MLLKPYISTVDKAPRKKSKLNKERSFEKQKIAPIASDLMMVVSLAGQILHFERHFRFPSVLFEHAKYSALEEMSLMRVDTKQFLWLVSLK